MTTNTPRTIDLSTVPCVIGLTRDEANKIKMTADALIRIEDAQVHGDPKYGQIDFKLVVHSCVSYDRATKTLSIKALDKPRAYALVGTLTGTGMSVDRTEWKRREHHVLSALNVPKSSGWNLPAYYLRLYFSRTFLTSDSTDNVFDTIGASFRDIHAIAEQYELERMKAAQAEGARKAAQEKRFQEQLHTVLREAVAAGKLDISHLQSYQQIKCDVGAIRRGVSE